MKGILKKSLLSAAALPALSAVACIPSGDDSTIQQALKVGGAGAIVQLCPGAFIEIHNQITFTAPNQEISTQGYPTDNSRATLQIQPGNDVTTVIYGKDQRGVIIRNIHIDGNRRQCGYMHTGGANIELGGFGNNQVVTYVKSEDPRTWSCCHVIGSGVDNNPCTNATITHNDIGPCGSDGHDADGNGLWADGISLDCTNSLVQYNTVNGATDGAIVIFGSPGSLVDGNIIISSETEVGFGGINMVDDVYHGSYAGVVVSNNIMIGKKLLMVGSAVGSDVWAGSNAFNLSGPATIINNAYIGNIGMPIVVNGWEGGLTISNNDVSGVTADKSSYLDATQCSTAVQNLYNKNDRLIYYGPGLTGPQSLQSGFDASPDNFNSLLCVTTPLPNFVSFEAGTLSIGPSSVPVARVRDGFLAFQNNDGNFVAYMEGNPVWASGIFSNDDCFEGTTTCLLQFTSDGNIVISYKGQIMWHTNTAGQGQTLIFQNLAPWIMIEDGRGVTIWDTTDGFQRSFSGVLKRL